MDFMTVALCDNWIWNTNTSSWQEWNVFWDRVVPGYPLYIVDGNTNSPNCPSFDWQPDDPHKMHFAQLPDEAGWDVRSTSPFVLADDWQCSETGWVKGIHFWGSWLDGNTGEYSSFNLSIHEDVPAQPPDIPYSRPGTTLWELEATDFNIIHIDPPSTGGWYVPSDGTYLYDNHASYFMYNVEIPEEFWFLQQQGNIYWLSISADNIIPTDCVWGWRSSYLHWNDDAVWAELGNPDWTDIYEPPPQIKSDHYSIEVNQYGQLLYHGGSGYRGRWYYYENTDWWNIWFYDHPYSKDRYTVVNITFDVTKFSPTDAASVEVAINWATPEWSLEGNPPGYARRPPITPLSGEEEDLYIGRNQLLFMDNESFTPGTYSFPFTFPDFNPEWISIDVRGYNFRIGVSEAGTTEHISFPKQEPQSLDLSFVITGDQDPALGACCYEDGTCNELSEIDCFYANGEWHGAWIECLGDNSPVNSIDDVCDYVCGDADGNKAVDLLDIVFMIDNKFKEGPLPDPIVSVDVNNDGFYDLLDIIYMIDNKFKDGPEPLCHEY
jgi:hypothetical protein